MSWFQVMTWSLYYGGNKWLSTPAKGLIGRSRRTYMCVFSMVNGFSEWCRNKNRSDFISIGIIIVVQRSARFF